MRATSPTVKSAPPRILRRSVVAGMPDLSATHFCDRSAVKIAAAIRSALVVIWTPYAPFDYYASAVRIFLGPI